MSYLASNLHLVSVHLESTNKYTGGWETLHLLYLPNGMSWWRFRAIDKCCTFCVWILPPQREGAFQGKEEWFLLHYICSYIPSNTKAVEEKQKKHAKDWETSMLCVQDRVCVCVCVCMCGSVHIHTKIYTHKPLVVNAHFKDRSALWQVSWTCAQKALHFYPRSVHNWMGGLPRGPLSYL